MKKNTQEYEDRISNIIKIFFNDQLNENLTVVETHIDENEFRMIMHDALSPAELVLAGNFSDSTSLIDFKSKQFKTVKNLLQVKLEDITGNKVHGISTDVNLKGIRAIRIQFNKSFNSSTLKKGVLL